MPTKLMRSQIEKKAGQLLLCQTNKQVEQLLHLPQMQLSATAFLPQYYCFEIRKTKGGFRQIEAPEFKLDRY